MRNFHAYCKISARSHFLHFWKTVAKLCAIPVKLWHKHTFLNLSKWYLADQALILSKWCLADEGGSGAHKKSLGKAWWMLVLNWTRWARMFIAKSIAVGMSFTGECSWRWYANRHGTPNQYMHESYQEAEYVAKTVSMKLRSGWNEGRTWPLTGARLKFAAGWIKA